MYVQTRRIRNLNRAYAACNVPSGGFKFDLRNKKNSLAKHKFKSKLTKCPPNLLCTLTMNVHIYVFV